jgi:hypothetical protein
MEKKLADRLKARTEKRFKTFIDVIEESPFEPLREHARVVHKCVNALHKMMGSFINQDFGKLNAQWQTVQNLEYEADLVKNAIREHMPITLYVPIPTSNIYEFLREMDDIADCAENVSDILILRETRIPDPVKRGFVRHMETVIKTVNVLVDEIDKATELFKTKVDKERKEELLKKLYAVSQMEWKADGIKRDIKKKIYGLEHELNVFAIKHLLDILHEMDEIADHSENVEARLRTILVR